VHHLLDSEQWVTHTEQVIAATNQISRLVVDAETGQRGFLLTGDDKYLEPYERASREIGPALSRLRQLTSDNPVQSRPIAHLQSVSSDKLKELSRTVELARAGNRSAAIAIVRMGKGQQLMTELRSDLDQIRRQEDRLLSIREADALRSRQRAIGTVIVDTAVALALVVLVTILVDRGIRLRERANAEIRRSEQWFRTTLASVGDAVIATDAAGVIRFLNPAAERATGYSNAEATGHPLPEVFLIFNERTGSKVENPVSRVLATGRVVGLANHTVLRRKDGAEIPIDDSAAPIMGDNGEVLGVVLIFRDVSERREAEEALIAGEKLVATVRLAATVAHEINNPLASVTNLLYLADRASPDKMREYVRMADKEIKRVAEITRRSLAFYRQPAKPAECRVSELLDEVIELYQPEIRNRGIQVQRDFAVQGEITAWPGELRQVFSNLLLNALDASPPNGTIRTRVRDISQGVLVSFEDEGDGIPLEVQGKIFKPFFTTKSERGNGLGLWASKRMVERHGGSISFASRSAQHRGTRFDVFLPRTAHADAARRVV
jgi:PAS domain S-box-containing protein